MATAYPPEFRRRAVELANQRDHNGERVTSIAQIAKDLGIANSCLRNWIRQDEIETGRRDGQSVDERKELTELRRCNKVLEMEVEVLKRASAYFARENVLPK